LKSTETLTTDPKRRQGRGIDFSNFGSLKSTETPGKRVGHACLRTISAISAR